MPSGRRLFGGDHERRGKPGAHLGRRRRQRVFRQSGHLGDAFCRRARPGRRDALRAGPL